MEESSGTSLLKFELIGTYFILDLCSQMTLFSPLEWIIPDNLLFRPLVPPPKSVLPPQQPNLISFLHYNSLGRNFKGALTLLLRPVLVITPVAEGGRNK
jgi:hypothetical protein